MKILITGGTGVIGAGVIPELIARGHQLRHLSRHASDDSDQWKGVEALDGDVTDMASLAAAAHGCDAVLHIAGIVKENPPDATFALVNVGGTENILGEATRAGVSRFVFVSSLGADSGTSDYHRSKLAAERLVEKSSLAWSIIRPGSVYGPGDEVLSQLLKTVRASPIVPTIGSGEQPFQPIWYEDLGKAIATVIEREDLSGRTIELAGPDVTTMTDLIARFSEITGRSPIRVPVPEPLASAAVTAATVAAIDVPVDESKLTMLLENNVLKAGEPDALSELLGITPTPLDRGLRLLADVNPEVLPEEGFGAMEHKRYFADIRGTSFTAPSLMKYFRDHVTEIMPIEFAAEPGAATRLDEGSTLTAAMPLRGNIQVRVEAVEPTHVVLGTVEGHPLAGVVEFTTSDSSGTLRFAIDIWARASNLFDFIALHTLGKPMQAANWRSVVQRVIEASGGTSTGVESESRKLSESEAEAAEIRIKSIVMKRRREHPERGETRV